MTFQFKKNTPDNPNATLVLANKPYRVVTGNWVRIRNDERNVRIFDQVLDVYQYTEDINETAGMMDMSYYEVGMIVRMAYSV